MRDALWRVAWFARLPLAASLPLSIAICRVYLARCTCTICSTHSLTLLLLVLGSSQFSVLRMDSSLILYWRMVRTGSISYGVALCARARLAAPRVQRAAWRQNAANHCCRAPLLPALLCFLARWHATSMLLLRAVPYITWRCSYTYTPAAATTRLPSFFACLLPCCLVRRLRACALPASCAFLFLWRTARA